MALYIPAGTRRRRTIVLAIAALVAGLVIGVVAGRGTAPTVEDRIGAVQADARQTAAGLRVLALHDEAGAVSEGDGGAALVLARTRTELARLFDRAPWLGAADRQSLEKGLDDLEAIDDRSGGEFGEAAEALAAEIEATFGLALGSGASSAN